MNLINLPQIPQERESMGALPQVSSSVREQRLQPVNVNAFDPSSLSPKELTKRANVLLRKKGFRIDGRPSGCVPIEQTFFERSFWIKGFRGKSRPNS